MTTPSASRSHCSAISERADDLPGNRKIGLVSLKEYRKRRFRMTYQSVTTMGQLFDIVKKRRKRNVDGEVLAN